MKRSNLASFSHTMSLPIMVLLFTATVGCSDRSIDSGSALQALSNIHQRLAIEEQQQADLVERLATAMTDVAKERLRLMLLLDIDELTSPDGEADATRIQRLLQDGSENAVVSELRLGRMSLDQATQLVGDATAARLLSPQLRAAAEEKIVTPFSAWQQLASTRQTLLAHLREHHTAATRMFDEASRLVDAIRSASTHDRDRTVQLGLLAGQATELIDDRELRESTRSLIDLLLNPAAPNTNSTVRSQD